MLGQMLELAMILRRRRKCARRAGTQLCRRSRSISDAEGQVTGAHLAQHDESHQVIEEFMLAANEAVAATLAENEIGFLRRAHPDPEPFKLDEFAEFVRSLGLTIDQPQSRFELQRVLNETVGNPEEYAVHYGLLRSLKQATYTPEPEGHLCAGQRGLLPLHLADPALSRPAGSSPVDRLARREKVPRAPRRAVCSGAALHAHRAQGRGRRTRADPSQASGLPRRTPGPVVSRESSSESRISGFSAGCRSCQSTA